jgi:hypothetical protein
MLLKSQSSDHPPKCKIAYRDAKRAGGPLDERLATQVNCVIHRHPFNAMVGNPGLEDGYGSSIKTAPYLGADV